MEMVLDGTFELDKLDEEPDTELEAPDKRPVAEPATLAEELEILIGETIDEPDDEPELEEALKLLDGDTELLEDELDDEPELEETLKLLDGDTELLEDELDDEPELEEALKLLDGDAELLEEELEPLS
ncbi:hypothetical protein MBLNU459_g5167t1 [Dothideomycetes sp. NU459]